MREFNDLRNWLIRKVKETNTVKVGELTGLHPTAVKKIYDGDMTNPTRSTMTKIQIAMEEDLRLRWDGIIVKIPIGEGLEDKGGKDGKIVQVSLNKDSEFEVYIHPFPENGVGCLNLTSMNPDSCCVLIMMDKEAFIDMLQGMQIYLE